MDKNELLSFISDSKTLLLILIPFITGILYVLAAGAKFIEISIIACIGLMCARIFSKRLNYKQAWVLSAFSGTLMTIFFALTDFFHIFVQMNAMIHWIVTLLFLGIAVKYIPSTIRKQTA